jgi:putative glutamine amidotransferase
MSDFGKPDYPLVGIGANVDDDQPEVQNIYENYVDAIYNAGCIPLVIPLPNIGLRNLYASLAERVLENLGGIMLSGGADINAKLYGEDNMPYNGKFYDERDLFEIALCKCALKLKKPILGICRGMQLLNVAMGGTLFQDIEAQNPGKPILMHSQKAPSYSSVHSVKFAADTKIASLLLEPDELEEKSKEREDRLVSVQVNSFHHQAVKAAAPGLRVSAVAGDGLIEAIEPAEGNGDLHPFTIGVQWHPERMWRHCDHAERLFSKFAEACKKPRRQS